MPETCHYHSAQPAYWFCPQCQQYHCKACIVRRSPSSPLSEQFFYLCPSCGGYSEFIGITNVMAPFWQRLVRILTYPLSGRGPLLLLALAALLGGLVAEATIWGKILANLLVLAILTYAYAGLMQTAEGKLHPPALTWASFKGEIRPVLQQYLLFLAVGFSGSYLYIQHGPMVGIGFGLVSILLLPSVIMLLFTTRRFTTALNPLLGVQLIFRIGRGYLLMTGILIALMGVPWILARYADLYFDLTKAANLPHLLCGLTHAYYIILAYHLIGYVILQYHDHIGFDIDYEDLMDPTGDKALAAPLTWSQEALQRANLMANDGRPEAAIALIQEATAKQKFNDLELSERYLELLKQCAYTASYDRHAPRHLWLLIKAGRKAAACQLYKELVAADPEFSLHPDQMFELAKWLEERENPQVALKTLKRLVASHPRDPLVPKAYYRIAQLANDRMLDISRTNLKEIIRKHPEQEIILKAKKFLANLGA